MCPTRCDPPLRLHDPIVLMVAAVLTFPSLYLPKAGDVVIHEGDHGSNMYILLEGAAVATQLTAAHEKVPVMQYAAGDYFGELAALGTNSGTRRASVEISSEEAHLVSISEGVFDRLLLHCKAEMLEHAKGYKPHA